MLPDDAVNAYGTAEAHGGFDRPELEGRCGICDTLIVDGNCPECYPDGVELP